MEKLKKRVVCLMLVMAMAVTTLAGCGSKEKESSDSATAADSAEKKVIVAIGGDPATFTPFAPFNLGTLSTTLLEVYQPLFITNGFGGELFGVLGKSYESIDGFNYKVTLYDNIHDSEGNPFTADDVVWNIGKIKEYANFPNTDILEGATKLDDYTVQLTFNINLDENVGYWENWNMNLVMCTQKAFEESGDNMNSMAVGTGPYKVKEYVAGSKLILEKNENYWQTEDVGIANTFYAQNVDEIEYQFITDPSQVSIALETGTVDMSHDISTVDVPRFLEGGQYAEDFNVNVVPSHVPSYMGFNCSEDSILNDEDLRKALAYCWDADGIIQGAYAGDGERCYGLMGNPRYADWIDEWEGRDYFDYDVDKAKEYLNTYLKKTGKKAEDITIRMFASDGSGTVTKNILETMQGYIMALGLNCTIETKEQSTWNEFLSDPASWDVMIELWGSGGYFTNNWQQLLSKDSTAWKTSSFNFVDDDELDELVKLCNTVDGHTPENIQKTQDYIDDHCYAVGICYTYDYSICADWVESCFIDKRGWIMPGSCTYDWEAKGN